MDAFFAGFAELEDSRDDNDSHNLFELLVSAICAMLCRAGRFNTATGSFSGHVSSLCAQHSACSANRRRQR